MVEKIFQDALFAAIAAIGFAAISRPPRRAYVYCALIAAVGHSLRFVLMDCLYINIILSTAVASFAVGVLSVYLSPVARTPAEACFSRHCCHDTRYVCLPVVWRACNVSAQ